MQGWLKNGARMTVAVTAFAAAGAGVAYAHESSPALRAGHTAIELTALQLPAGGPLAKQFGQITGIGGPLGCTSYIGKPMQTVHVPADEDAASSEAARYGMGVLGTDTDEEFTNPADIPGSDRDTSTALGAGDTDEESTGPTSIPAADQDDQTCTTASAASSTPSGHHHGSGHHGMGAGKHHGTGSGTGKHHHGTGSGSKHHGTGSGKGKGMHGKGMHGKGMHGRHGMGKGMHHMRHMHGRGKGMHGKHGMGMNGGSCHHHMNGGKPASSSARSASLTAATASSSTAGNSSTAASSSTAAASGTLPTTGAPLAALLGLAVAALAAGLVVRKMAKRDDEAEEA
jgi:hypothetical protein